MVHGPETFLRKQRKGLLWLCQACLRQNPQQMAPKVFIKLDTRPNHFRHDRADRSGVDTHEQWPKSWHRWYLEDCRLQFRSPLQPQSAQCQYLYAPSLASANGLQALGPKSMAPEQHDAHHISLLARAPRAVLLIKLHRSHHLLVSVDSV